MRNRPYIKRAAAGLLALAIVGGGFVAWRAYRMADMAWDFESQIRYMIDNGGTVGAAPAQVTFSDLFLEAMFGDNPDLLDQLRVVVRRGLEQDPDLNMGEVAAMIVTHRQDDDGNVIDVAAHIVGGFPLGRMSPQFHRDGFFRGQVDGNLWEMGNSMLRFLGRDMVLFADETVAQTQTEIIEGILQGNIIPLVNNMERPIYYTAVFPEPRRLVPNQLRHHVQAIVNRGMISPYEGRSEFVILTASTRSANYAMSIFTDLKRVAEMALKTKFKGVVQETDWGPVINPWWSYEMVQTSERMVIEREENIVRMRTEFERIMVNAVLKTLERFGRDWRSMRLTMEEGMDPREVDRLMATRKPLHYWSDEHRWGPDWPIAPSEEELAAREQAQEVRRLERAAVQTSRTAERTAIAAERAEQRAAAAEAQLAAQESPTPLAEETARLARELADLARQRATDAARDAELAAQEAQRAAQEAGLLPQ